MAKQQRKPRQATEILPLAFYTTLDVAQLLGLTERTISAACTRSHDPLPSSKELGVRWIKGQHLIAWLEKGPSREELSLEQVRTEARERLGSAVC